MRKKTDESMVLIGANIRKARQRSDLTQEQLAELIEVTPQYLSDLERGVVGTSISTLILLCKKLNVTADFILFGTENDDDSEVMVLLERIKYMPKYKADMIERAVNLLLDAFDSDPNEKKA